jgi:hypothetical protein
MEVETMTKRSILIALAGLALLLPAASLAQTGGTTQPAPQKTLAATMGVYVYPTKGQTPEQQSMDEAECYNWAVGQTGTDPFELAKQAEAQLQQAEAAKQEVAQAGQGAGAKGAVAGAAAGAAVGKIAKDDAGKGAAYGAAAGGIAARRKVKKEKSKANEQIEQQEEQVKQATQKQLDDFKKAFSVCLEAREYMVK